jgi:hypothetical protein
VLGTVNRIVPTGFSQLHRYASHGVRALIRLATSPDIREFGREQSMQLDGKSMCSDVSSRDPAILGAHRNVHGMRDISASNTRKWLLTSDVSAV